MTLEEIIKKEKKTADANYEMAKSCHTDEGVYLKEEGAYRDRAEYHEQLAEWLRELKALRIAVYKLSRIPYGEYLTYKADDIWDLFGTYFADFEQEVMEYEEVKADDSGMDS